MPTQTLDAERDALIEALYCVPENGRAEIIRGTIVQISAAGTRLGRIAGRIFISLSRHEERLDLVRVGQGYAFCGNVGFLVDLPNRGSFSPNSAWYTCPLEEEPMQFLPHAPAPAVEVRSENDYGPKAERDIAEKIADYFAAGTQVIWNVDALGPDVVRVHQASDPNAVTVCRRGDVAGAKPAVSGWTMAIDALLPGVQA